MSIFLKPAAIVLRWWLALLLLPAPARGGQETDLGELMRTQLADEQT